MPETLVADGVNFVKSEEGHRGKKAQQVARIIEVLQENAGVPCDFDWVCEQAGAKYPVDVQAAVMALEMVEHVDLYVKSAESTTRRKIYYCWVGPVNPTNGSSE